MDVSLLSKDKEKVQLHVKGTNAAMMNAVRRSIVNKVPVMAIDTVEFVENSSALYDEMLAHNVPRPGMGGNQCRGAGKRWIILQIKIVEVGNCPFPIRRAA